MKILKFDEKMAYDLSKKELDKIRNRAFKKNTKITYNVYGENLTFYHPKYDKLNILYSIEECVNWYIHEKKSPKSRMNTYDNIFFEEETLTNKLIDLSSFIDAQKYNL
jgi:hypothetical protein